MTHRAHGHGQTQGDTDPPQPAPPHRAHGCGHGQTQGDTDPPQPAPPVAAPIIAGTPTTVLLGASNTIQRHCGDHRLLENHDNEDNVEIYNIDVSGDEEEEDVPPTRVQTHPRKSPLQTTTDTARSDPLFTVGGTQQIAAVDVHELTIWIDDYRACRLCQDLRKLVPSHHVATYAASTSTGVIRTHITINHMLAYIKKILYNNWRIQHKPLRAVVDSSWTLEELKHKLQQDPHCDVTLLGPCSNTGVALAGVTGSRQQAGGESREEEERLTKRVKKRKFN